MVLHQSNIKTVNQQQKQPSSLSDFTHYSHRWFKASSIAFLKFQKPELVTALNQRWVSWLRRTNQVEFWRGFLIQSLFPTRIILAFQLQSLMSRRKAEIPCIQKLIDKSYTIIIKSAFRKHNVRDPRYFSCPEVSQMCTLQFSSQMEENSRPMVLLISRGRESQRRRWTTEVFPEEGGPVNAIFKIDFCIRILIMKNFLKIGLGVGLGGTALSYYFLTNPIYSTPFFLYLSETRIKPDFLRLFILNRFIEFYRVDRSEILDPLQKFETFSQFFTRRVSGIEFDTKKERICCPANSRIISIEKVESNQAQIVAKGKTYSIDKFLGYSLDFADKNIYQVVFYLSPADCHRFFSPCPLEIGLVKDLGGIHKSTNPKYTVSSHPVTEKAISLNPNIYIQNFRRIARGVSKIGETKVNINLGFVGAVNVGGIDIFPGSSNANLYQKGSTLGVFRIGSTIVMMVQVPKERGVRVLRGKGKIRAGEGVFEII